MEKFTKSKLVAQIALTSFVAALAIVGVAYATTIGTNISTTGTLATATTTIAAGDLIVDTDTLIVDNDNNRVGVGTTTPSYLLDVDGNFRVGIETKVDTFFVNTATQRVGAGTTTPAYLLDVDGDLRVGIEAKANTLRVDTTNQKVGIGSSTPTTALSIGTDSATSTISTGKFCMVAKDQEGSTFYVTFNMAAADAGAGIFATSTIDCR
ncbi:MAG: hypothetical protein PHR36_01915 [Patescibacteria group bacterium]|nr:hypothetical protein [Patescibacteria group bacterium]